MPPIEYFGVMIPILGIMLGFFGVWTQHKQKVIRLQLQAGSAGATSSAQTRAQAEQIKELQERVQVLERIVTDGGYDLAHKIEALRDQRVVPAGEALAEPERLS